MCLFLNLIFKNFTLESLLWSSMNLKCIRSLIIHLWSAPKGEKEMFYICATKGISLGHILPESSEPQLG